MSQRTGHNAINKVEYSKKGITSKEKMRSFGMGISLRIEQLAKYACRGILQMIIHSSEEMLIKLLKLMLDVLWIIINTYLVLL